MATNIAQPLQLGSDITCKATSAVTGRRFVAISTNGSKGVPNVAHATAGVQPFGVSAYDAANGEALPVIRKTIVQVTAGAALSAGNEVQVGTAGVAIVKDAGVAVGRVVFDAANGAPAFIDLY